MKEIVWDNPNKMHMDSGFKLFDKQTNVITTGNAICNTQMSSYIRPYSEVKNGGYIGKPGDFVKFDMQYFRDVPEHMLQIIYDKERKESVILYQFFVFHGDEKEIIGYVLTDNEHKYISSSTYCPYKGNWFKRNDAIIEACKYICEEESE